MSLHPSFVSPLTIGRLTFCCMSTLSTCFTLTLHHAHEKHEVPTAMSANVLTVVIFTIEQSDGCMVNTITAIPTRASYQTCGPLRSSLQRPRSTSSPSQQLLTPSCIFLHQRHHATTGAIYLLRLDLSIWLPRRAEIHHWDGRFGKGRCISNWLLRVCPSL